jgi:hypothetical protein
MTSYNPTMPETQLQGYQFHPKHKISIRRYFHRHEEPTRQIEIYERTLCQNNSWVQCD